MAESNWNSNAYNENPPKWYSPEYNKAVRGVVGQAAMAPINAARNQIAEDINSAVDPEYGVNKSRQYWENNPGYYPDSLNPSAVAGVYDREVYSKYFNRAAPYGALSVNQPTGLSPEESLGTQSAPEPVNTPNTNVTQDPATPFQILKSNPNQPTEGLSPTSADPQKGILSQQQTNQTGIVGDSSVARLQAQVGNRMAGVGDGFGNLEPAPQPPIKQSYAEQMKDIGDRVALDQNSIPDWHESDSFNYALINFGLNLLSGNDLANSFSNASTTFIDMFGREKREIWAEDLRRQGYDDTEIQRYIETGDNKVLTNPFEKKRQLLEYNRAAAELDQALYENDPKTRQYKIDRQNWEDRIKLTEIQDRRTQAAADLNLRREEMKMRRQEAAERRLERKAMAEAKLKATDPLTAEFGANPKVLKLIQGQVKPYVDRVSVKASFLDQAELMARKAKQLQAEGKWSEATKQLDGAKESYAKAFKGGYGSVTAKDIDYHAGDPVALRSGASWVGSHIVGRTPDWEIDRAIAMASNARGSEHAALNKFLENKYKNLAAELGEERAQRVMYLAGLSSNSDPVDYSELSPEQVDQGVLTIADKNTVQITRD